MLSISSQSLPSNGLMDNVLLKLGLLFFGVFLFTFLTFLAYGAFISSVESYSLQSNVPAAPVVGDIDPKIATDLAKVLEAEESDVEFAAKDPFQDRSGITRFGNPADSSSNARLRTQSGAVNPGGALNRTANTPGSGSRSGNPDYPVGGSGPVRPPELSTRDRYGIWMERARYGSLGEPSASIFSIDDLIPVGVVDGGNNGEEIMFFSEAADRILSFPVGTRLYDGWILEVRSEGVVFGTADPVAPRRLKSWGRSVKSKGSQSFSLLNPDPSNSFEAPVNAKESIAGGNN